MDFNITIIGAGVVGLSIAALLSKNDDNIVVVEKNKKFGQETSSRNSEVIHSGIYYKPESLKAKLCIEGQKYIYEYCKKKEIQFKKLGKYIVATNKKEEEILTKILHNAQLSRVKNGKIIDAKELKLKENKVVATKALYFSETGVVDSHSFMKALETDIINNNAEIVYQSKVIDIKKIKNGYKIYLLENTGGIFNFTTNILINSAGLFAHEMSKKVGINKKEYEVSYWKGEYFSLGNGKNKFIKSLIYPIPEEYNKGLGIHTTTGLDGNVKIGPNAIYLPNTDVDYKVNESNINEFYESIKKILPFIEKKDLRPDQAGVRPKLQKPGEPARDFIIKNEKEDGYKNFINIIGIESPGLTASMAIAEYVKKIII